jgi:hypothetical protein
MAIPAFHDYESLDRVGFMLEAISAESRYTVIPAHHDVQLQGKFIRDEESSEMLDIIFNSVVWDPSDLYPWVGGQVWFSVSSGKLASTWESYLGRTESAIQKTIDAFEHIY